MCMHWGSFYWLRTLGCSSVRWSLVSLYSAHCRLRVNRTICVSSISPGSAVSIGRKRRSVSSDCTIGDELPFGWIARYDAQANKMNYRRKHHRNEGNTFLWLLSVFSVNWYTPIFCSRFFNEIHKFWGFCFESSMVAIRNARSKGE